jgi:Holliday junction resolvase RusA-like endonuclease
MWSVTLPYPPKGTNHQYIRTRRGVHMDSDVQAWRTLVAYALRTVSAEARLAGAVEMVIDIYRPSRRGDIDNRLKLLLDALQGVAYANDAQVTRLTVNNLVDKHAPRVEISWWQHDLMPDPIQMVQEV